MYNDTFMKCRDPREDELDKCNGKISNIIVQPTILKTYDMLPYRAIKLAKK